MWVGSRSPRYWASAIGMGVGRYGHFYAAIWSVGRLMVYRGQLVENLLDSMEELGLWFSSQVSQSFYSASWSTVNTLTYTLSVLFAQRGPSRRR